MKKVRLRFAEYMASLPPYRFQPGDVIEIDDDWADQLVRRGIAGKATASAETVQEKRAAMFEEQESARSANLSETALATRRAALQAQLDELDQMGAESAAEGHYGDTMTREDMGASASGAAASEDEPAAGRTAAAAGRRRASE